MHRKNYYTTPQDKPRSGYRRSYHTNFVVPDFVQKMKAEELVLISAVGFTKDSEEHILKNTGHSLSASQYAVAISWVKKPWEFFDHDWFCTFESTLRTKNKSQYILGSYLLGPDYFRQFEQTEQPPRTLERAIANALLRDNLNKTVVVQLEEDTMKLFRPRLENYLNRFAKETTT